MTEEVTLYGPKYDFSFHFENGTTPKSSGGILSGGCWVKEIRYILQHYTLSDQLKSGPRHTTAGGYDTRLRNDIQCI